MEIIQPTVEASLVVILYVLIERVVVPLLAKDNTSGRDSTDGNGNKRHQDYVNRTVEHRLDRLDEQLAEHSATINDVGAKVSVIKAIVERIERRTK